MRDGETTVTTTTPPIADVGYGRAPTRLDRFLYAPAVVDWIIAGYFFSVIIGLSRAQPTPERNYYLIITGLVLVGFLTLVYLWRFKYEARERNPSYLALVAYRLLPVGALLAVYFNLRPILPMINPATYDDALYQIDLAVFGFEPTLFVEQYSSRTVVEWFSFFYYGYFFFISTFIFLTIFSDNKERRLAYFGAGFAFVCCVGHVIYTFVPGYGPYHYLAHDYRGPLAGGPFYAMVLEAVSGAGALRDIFPSLHTALPTFCTLFAWRHHRKWAPLATFICLNIIIATVVLRWHYAADVAAGLILAITGFLLTPKLVELYQLRRSTVGLAFRRW